MNASAGQDGKDSGETQGAQTPSAGDHDSGTQPSSRRKTILVVDDEPAVAAILCDIFHLEGYEVQLTENGATALEKLQQGTYDLIVSDIRMPKVDGLALYHAIKQSYPQLLQRFIFLTGDTVTPGILEFLERTELPFVSKPFTLEAMRQAVRQVFEVHDKT